MSSRAAWCAISKTPATACKYWGQRSEVELVSEFSVHMWRRGNVSCLASYRLVVQTGPSCSSSHSFFLWAAAPAPPTGPPRRLVQNGNSLQNLLVFLGICHRFFWEIYLFFSVPVSSLMDRKQKKSRVKHEHPRHTSRAGGQYLTQCVLACSCSCAPGGRWSTGLIRSGAAQWPELVEQIVSHLKLQGCNMTSCPLYQNNKHTPDWSWSFSGCSAPGFCSCFQLFCFRLLSPEK